jgi:hypothetical protein
VGNENTRIAVTDTFSYKYVVLNNNQLFRGMIELIIAISSGFVGWVITHIYHRKASTNPPEWAKPLIEKLPDVPPSREKLIELINEAFDSGILKPDPILGYVACPNCKSPSLDFGHRTFSDERTTVVVVDCPHCGWSETAEV